MEQFEVKLNPRGFWEVRFKGAVIGWFKTEEIAKAFMLKEQFKRKVVKDI